MDEMSFLIIIVSRVFNRLKLILWIGICAQMFYEQKIDMFTSVSFNPINNGFENLTFC